MRAAAEGVVGDREAQEALPPHRGLDRAAPVGVFAAVLPAFGGGLPHGRVEARQRRIDPALRIIGRSLYQRHGRDVLRNRRRHAKMNRAAFRERRGGGGKNEGPDGRPVKPAPGHAK